MTSLNDYRLATNIAAGVFCDPDCGKEGFLAIGELHFHTAHGSAGIGDYSLVPIIPLFQGGTETMG